MSREEIKKFLLTINSLYANFKPDDLTLAVDSWCWALADYTAEQAMGALKIYMKTSNTGFAPSASQIIGCINKPKDNEYISEGEAWAMVKRAIQDGNYHSAERFEELPPLVQKAVGGANMIRQWAMSDTDDVNTVIASNFQRNYRTLVQRQQFDDKVPPALADIVKGVSQKIAGQIEKKEQ
jgi:hypothetical protein